MNGKDTKNADVVVNYNYLAPMLNVVKICYSLVCQREYGYSWEIVIYSKRCGLLDQYTNRMLSTHNTLPGQPVNAS